MNNAIETGVKIGVAGIIGTAGAEGVKAAPSSLDIATAFKNQPPAIVESIGMYDVNRPIKTSKGELRIAQTPATLTPVSKEVHAEELRLLTVPAAKLSQDELTRKQQLFPEGKTAFAGIFKGIAVDAATKRVEEPLTTPGSVADTRIQAVAGVISEANQLKGEADLVIGFSGEEAAPVVRINKNITVTLADGKKREYRGGTYFFIGDDGKLAYFEPSGRRDWRIKLFQADQQFQTDLARFTYTGQPLRVNAGDWVMAEVDGANHDVVKTILLPGLALNLYGPDDPNIPKATAQPDASTDLLTPQAPEVRAKRAKETVELTAWNTLPNKDYPVSAFPPDMQERIKADPDWVYTISGTGIMIDTRGGKDFINNSDYPITITNLREARGMEAEAYKKRMFADLRTRIDANKGKPISFYNPDTGNVETRVITSNTIPPVVVVFHEQHELTTQFGQKGPDWAYSDGSDPYSTDVRSIGPSGEIVIDKYFATDQWRSQFSSSGLRSAMIYKSLVFGLADQRFKTMREEKTYNQQINTFAFIWKKFQGGNFTIGILSISNDELKWYKDHGASIDPTAFGPILSKTSIKSTIKRWEEEQAIKAEKEHIIDLAVAGMNAPSKKQQA